MTEAQAIEAISALAVSATAPSLAALWPTFPVLLENDAAPAADTWARVTIRNTSSRQVSIGPVGSRRFERRGFVYVQLFGPVDAGRAGLAALVQDVRTIYESQQLAADLWTYAANPQDVGSDGRWFNVTVSIPYTFYETR